MSQREWTPEQRAAITKRGTNLLVAAGAGSGKTAVLVERVISFLTQEDPLEIDQILVVTFTNAAAAEMRQRIGEALENLISQDRSNAHLRKQLALLPRASICTLHSFCLDLVRQFFYKLDLDPGIRVANAMETAMLEEDAMEEVFRRRYDDRDEELQLLLSCFGNGPWDDALREQIQRLSAFSRATPNPTAWLSALPLAYEGKDQSWFDYLFAMVQKEIVSACQALTMAKALCDKADGPHVYGEAIEQELAQLQGLQKAKDWQELAWLLSAVAFTPRLPSVRKTDGVNSSLKEGAQASRNTAKTMIKGLKETYFADPLAAEEVKLAKMQPIALALANLTISYHEQLTVLKKAKRLIDFSDMEHDCLALLEEPSGEVRAALQAQYRGVFVDEYQDINQVQNCIIDLIAPQDNLFLVGDVKQSIYRFRLAEPELFQEKFAAYGQSQGGERIDLQKNFRSAPVILADINEIFSQLMTVEGAEIAYDHSAYLIPGAAATDEGQVELHLLQKEGELEETGEDGQGEEETPAELVDAQREARHIGKEIQGLHNRGYQYRDMVIILRSVKQDAPIFRQELAAMGIPCHGTGENTFYDAAEISTMISLLQVIDNPRQDIHLAAVLHSPIAGFTLEELAHLRLLSKEDLYDALLASETPKAQQFLAQLTHWRQPGRSNRISQLLGEIYQETGFYQLAGALPDGGQRQANLLFLLNQAKEYESTSYRGLYRFLTFIKRYIENGQGAENARTLGENENVVRIISIHHSKGLEFPIVFLARLGKSFHMRDCYKDVLLHKKLGLGLPYIDLEKKIKYPSLIHQALSDKIYWETIAEELRLLYVAMTRAKEKLYLVGVCGDLPGLLKNTAITCEVPQKELPPYLLDRGTNYLTWLVRSLLRHPDGEALRLLWFEEAQPQLVRNDLGGAFTIKIMDPPAVVAQGVKEVPVWLKQVSKGEPLFAQRDEAIAALMAWQYPQSQATVTPVKWTVTGLQHREQPAQEVQTNLSAAPISAGSTVDKIVPISAGSAVDKTAELQDFLQPTAHLAEKDAISRGITVHYLLEHLDFAAPEPADGLSALLRDCVAKGLCSAALAASLDLSVITDFLASPLGQRVLRATQVLREQPFILSAATETLGQSLPQGERVLLQGTVDLAFREAGGWVIVDYKYSNPRGRSAEEIIQTYGKQIVCYQQALTEILQEPCLAGYLYFLPARRMVTVFE